MPPDVTNLPLALIAGGMELDELSQSGIRRIADFSPYLDQLAGLAQEMGLRQRSNLVQLERTLHQHWSLGQNNILSWAPLDEGVLILVVPHYAIADYTATRSENLPPRVSPRFITELISGDRQLNFTQMQKWRACSACNPSTCRYANRSPVIRWKPKLSKR